MEQISWKVKEIEIEKQSMMEQIYSNNIGRKVAIILDNKVFMSPTIQSKISQEELNFVLARKLC